MTAQRRGRTALTVVAFLAVAIAAAGALLSFTTHGFKDQPCPQFIADYESRPSYQRPDEQQRKRYEECRRQQ